MRTSSNLLNFSFKDADIEALLDSDVGLRLWHAPQPPGPHAGCTPFANQPLDNLTRIFYGMSQLNCRGGPHATPAGVMDLTQRLRFDIFDSITQEPERLMQPIESVRSSTRL